MAFRCPRARRRPQHTFDSGLGRLSRCCYPQPSNPMGSESARIEAVVSQAAPVCMPVVTARGQPPRAFAHGIRTRQTHAGRLGAPAFPLRVRLAFVPRSFWNRCPFSLLTAAVDSDLAMAAGSMTRTLVRDSGPGRELRAIGLSFAGTRRWRRFPTGPRTIRPAQT